MIENLRKCLKNDIWKVINGEDIKDYKVEDFVYFIFYLLLECKSFMPEDVLDLAKKLKESYSGLIKDTYDLIEQDFGQILTVLKDVDKKFVQEINPIIEKIKRLKNDR